MEYSDNYTEDEEEYFQQETIEESLEQLNKYLSDLKKDRQRTQKNEMVLRRY